MQEVEKKMNDPNLQHGKLGVRELCGGNTQIVALSALFEIKSNNKFPTNPSSQFCEESFSSGLYMAM